MGWLDDTEGAVPVVATFGLNLLLILTATVAILVSGFSGQTIRWRTQVDVVAEERIDPSELM